VWGLGWAGPFWQTAGRVVKAIPGTRTGWLEDNKEVRYAAVKHHKLRKRLGPRGRGSNLLTLIGTVHRDVRGEARLGRLLTQLQPEIITLELSEVSLSYRRDKGEMQLRKLHLILERIAAERELPLAQLEAHPTVVQICKLLGLPFEYRAVSAYARSHQIPHVLIDLPNIAVGKLKRIESGLITLRNLKTLTGLPAEVAAESGEGYEVARALLGEKSLPSIRQAFLAGKRGVEGIGVRDQHMATEIRRQLTTDPVRHLIHVGGWVHLVEDAAGETLFSRLADLSPRRVLLDAEPGDLRPGSEHNGFEASVPSPIGESG